MICRGCANVVGCSFLLLLRAVLILVALATVSSDLPKEISLVKASVAKI